MEFFARDPLSPREKSPAGDDRGGSLPVSSQPLDTPPLFDLLTSPSIEFPAIETLSSPDEANGIWIASRPDTLPPPAALRRCEFQVACLAVEDEGATRSSEWAALKAVIAQQVFLRREWFAGEVVTKAPLSRRVVQELQREAGISTELASDIHRSIHRWVSAFAAISGASRVKLSLVSERGPRRLELEGGHAPASFHVDDSGLRLVAPILGPQTIFLLCGRGDGSVRLLTSPGRGPTLSDSSPFDLDSAVRASHARLFGAVPHSHFSFLRRAPDRFGILFPGALSFAERPLVHVAPHPRSGAEAISWARLFVTVDPI